MIIPAGIGPNPKQLAAVKEFPTPQTVSPVGLGYYRHYAILGYAISISQTFSHVNNIAYAIYRKILPHITGKIIYLMA